MKEDILINIIKQRLDSGQTKQYIKTAPIFKTLNEHYFEKIYNAVISERTKVNKKERKQRESQFGKKISFRISPELLEKFEHLTLSDVTFNPKNKSHNYRRIFEVGLKYKLLQLEKKYGK